MASRKPRKNAKRRAAKPVFTIYTEGMTEKEYFQLLASELRPCPVTFDIKVIGGDPSKVYSDLKTELTQRLRQLKREGGTANRDDRAFIVIDVDEHHKLTETLNKCQSSAIIDAVVSNPCFELWLLWHKVDITRFMTTSDCVKQPFIIHASATQSHFAAQRRDTTFNGHPRITIHFGPQVTAG